MNFQAVTVGQKLIEKGVGTGRYLDNIGTPGAPLLDEIGFVDQAIGQFVTEAAAPKTPLPCSRSSHPPPRTSRGSARSFPGRPCVPASTRRDFLQPPIRVHQTSSSISSPVETMQVAPTILKALGLDPNSLQAARQEHTQVLPGIPWSDLISSARHARPEMKEGGLVQAAFFLATGTSC